MAFNHSIIIVIIILFSRLRKGPMHVDTRYDACSSTECRDANCNVRVGVRDQVAVGLYQTAVSLPG